MRRHEGTYDDVTLGGRELQLLGKLRCPCRVCVLDMSARIEDAYGQQTFVPHAREMAVAATTDTMRVFLCVASAGMAMTAQDERGAL